MLVVVKSVNGYSDMPLYAVDIFLDKGRVAMDIRGHGQPFEEYTKVSAKAAKKWKILNDHKI